MIPKVIKKIKDIKNNRGILSCGTGVGVEVGANKFSGIRACLAGNEQIAQWSTVYDKCNVLCLTGWECKKEEIFKILEGWLTKKFDGDIKGLKMFDVFDTWH